MTKEMKRPTSHISGNSIKPALSKAVEFYTDNNRQAYECIRERDEYIDYLESQLSNASPHQALPVVPKCVGKYIEDCKKEGDCLFGVFADATRVEHDMPDLVYFWLGDEGNNDELFARAWLDGYQVEKQQLFYLKNKLTTSYLALDINTGYYEHWGEEIIPKLLNKQGYKTSFTQEEIDSMETGSYEQIEVTE